MTRRDLQYLSRQRIQEAKLLLDNNYYSGAYYLSGYSLEFAIKSSILKNIRAQTLPDKKFLQNFYIHDLSVLIRTAGLESLRASEEKTNPNFASNWGVVSLWNESSRYNIYTQIQAEEIYTAITKRNGGVLTWIRQYW